MTYSKTTWTDNALPYVDASHLNNIEQGIADAHDYALALVNTQTASYTIVLSDMGKVVELSNASAVNLTIPPNASVAFPIGAVVEIFQLGAGQITVVPGSGVTILSDGSKLKTAGQYATIGLRKRNTNEWVLSGDATT